MRGLLVMVVGLGLFFGFLLFYGFSFRKLTGMLEEMLFPVVSLFSFWGLCGGSFATILQVVINPYLTACHVKGTQAIQRLAIGGSANSVGTTLAPYFVTGVVFGGLAMEDIRIESVNDSVSWC